MDDCMGRLISEHDRVSRRDFIKSSAGAAASLAALSAGSAGLYAAGEERIRVGLVGCGGRGTGALRNLVDAAGHVNISLDIRCLADPESQRLAEAGEEFQVPPELCYSGFDGYRKVLQSDIDLVLLVTPPIFRPLHFEAAIRAGKHVFMEKPVAVDPVGARRMLRAGKLAGGGSVWWCMGALWHKNRSDGDSAADYLVKNWVSFVEMSGDHIIEQHVHNLDVANWFIGRHPRTALGFGGRSRRKTGNQYDSFSIDYDYGDGCRIHSMCRQINGCYDRVGEEFLGTDGSMTGEGNVKSAKSITAPEIEGHDDPYVQEHIDLLNSMLSGKPLNKTKNVTESTLTGMMGRISAYTGEIVRWSDLTDNKDSNWYKLAYSPSAEDFETGNVILPSEGAPPVPGADPKE
jgi:predicted dehydrogenase